MGAACGRFHIAIGRGTGSLILGCEGIVRGEINLHGILPRGQACEFIMPRAVCACLRDGLVCLRTDQFHRDTGHPGFIRILNSVLVGILPYPISQTCRKGICCEHARVCFWMMLTCRERDLRSFTRGLICVTVE